MIRGNLRLLSGLILVTLLTSISNLPGQPNGETHGKHQKFWQWLKHLPPDERSKYEAAKKEALKDPDIQAANERRKQADTEYRRLLHGQMLKIDPSLKSLLERIEQFRKH